MSSKHKRKGQASLIAQVQAHRRKIDAERKKELPDEGLIQHWRTEVQTWEKQIAQLQYQLTKHRRTGRRARHGES